MRQIPRRTATKVLQYPTDRAYNICRKGLVRLASPPLVRRTRNPCRGPPMRRPRRRSPVATALYLNAGLLGAVLVALLARGGGFGLTATANAAQPNPPAIGVVGNLALMPAQFSSNTWGCYVLDADKRT